MTPRVERIAIWGLLKVTGHTCTTFTPNQQQSSSTTLFREGQQTQ